MQRTAYVAITTDNADCFPTVLTAWEAVAFGGAVPTVVLKRLSRLSIDTSAACWVAFRPHASVPYDVFRISPGDALYITVSDVGLSMRDSLGTTVMCNLLVLRDDPAVALALRVVGEVTTT